MNLAPTLANRAIRKVVHLHGDGKILNVVKELEEASELLECDALQQETI